MHVRTRPRSGAAATGIAIAGVAAVIAIPSASAIQTPWTSPVSRDVALSASEVPPGGLLTSFLRNQVIYCSAICGPLVNTGAVAAVTTLQTPVTFVAAVQAGDLLRAIGATAASVTGPTNAALGAAILADTTVAVPKASNAFEVGVISLLDIVPAAAGALPGVAAAIEAAREQTFEALNLPVPVTGPTVVPNGVVQVATLGAIRVAEAVIFPAFNTVLQATVAVPDAAAQELAASGDPVLAVGGGAQTAAGSVSAVVNVVADSVVTAVNDVRDAAAQRPLGNLTVASQKASPATISRDSAVTPTTVVGTLPGRDDTPLGPAHPVRNVASTFRQAARDFVNNIAEHSSGSLSAKKS